MTTIHRALAVAIVMLLCGRALSEEAVQPRGFETALTSSITTLPFRVIDAEFSGSLNSIVAVAEAPFALYVHSPDTGNTATVLLPSIPRCVAVSPDGTFAAVGHNGTISYVDLVNATLVKTLDVSTDVLDIVLPGNGWVYAFPRMDQWEQIRCVQIATNTETLHSGGWIYAGTLARLHPGGTWIYGADNGLSPSDIEKYDVSAGTAVYKYDSPYHGDYGMCGNLWFSSDGQRIFTACGNMFRATSDPNTDMDYTGALSENDYVRWVAHSQAASNVAVIPRTSSYWWEEAPPADQEIYYYSTDFFAYRGKMLLPSFTVEENQWQSRGRWVFFNTAGTKHYVVVQADAQSGMLYDYGVVTVDCTNATVQLDPTTASTTASAANLQVTVTGVAGCGWRATANHPWLNSLTTGVGNGIVTISVAANQTTSPRTGTVTIGDATFTVHQAALVPLSLSATGTSSSSVSMTWSAPPVDHFEVWRNSGSGWTQIGSPVTPSFVDSTVPANSGFVYRVRAILNGGAVSEFSTPDYAHTFTFSDPSLAAGPIRAAHLTELRAAVNAMRGAAGLGSASFTDVSLQGLPAKRAHVTELREAIAGLRTSLSLTAYPFAALPAGSPIAAQPAAELRTAAQ